MGLQSAADDTGGHSRVPETAATPEILSERAEQGARELVGIVSICGSQIVEKIDNLASVLHCVALCC